jgi:hypothetical protein
MSEMLLPIKEKGVVVYETVVDSADYLWASQFNWATTFGQKYATRSQRRGHDNKPRRIFLHREILGLKHGYRDLMVDHIDGDPLNNRRSNLRIATAAQNCQNRRSQAGSSSRYRGVSWYSSKGCWRVAIMVDGVRTLVGYFDDDDEDEAGRAAEAFYAENMTHWSPRTAATAR